MPDNLNNSTNNYEPVQGKDFALSDQTVSPQPSSVADSVAAPNAYQFHEQLSPSTGTNISQPHSQQEPNLSPSAELSTVNQPVGQNRESGGGQKVILSLAIMLFVFSLAGLVFYIFSGVTSGRFSFGLSTKKEQPETTINVSPSPELVEATPTAVPVKEKSLYEDSRLRFEYPLGLSVDKSSDTLWIVKDDKTGDAIFAITLTAPSQKTTAEEFLVSEVLKLDKKLGKIYVKGLITTKDIGDYTVYSYNFSDGSALFVFEDKAAGVFVKISDFSYKAQGELEEDAAETIISTLSFVEKKVNGSLPVTTATPSATIKSSLED